MGHMKLDIAYDLQNLMLRCFGNALKKNRKRMGVEHNKGYIRHRRLQPAVDYIRENLDRPISVGEMVEAVGMSERTLSRYFNEQYGVSPYHYARLKRLEAVRKTLAMETSAPGLVTNAALEQGFDHLGRFSKEFREHFGLLPSEYAGLQKRTA